ncbi:MAG: LysR family transcriptional regulator [Gammaproteobacteria bacterium]|nr:LysR family transcriptional regulator [Gammaproteobacteria bacterium]
MNNLNWDLIRSFLAVARLGSLSAAARALGVSQPTLSRDIQAIESKTKINLFQRTTQGLNLTKEGQKLVDSAMQMEQAADLFQRQVSGLSEQLEGDVRISANEIVGIYLLPPAIAAFREEHPGVSVEITISNRAASLNKREADIALRMFRPSQPDLIARRLPDMELGFFAHRNYLEKFGIPENIEDFKSHNLIGFDEDLDFIEGAAQMGYQFVRDNFKIRTDHMLTQIQLARAGAGIVGTHVAIAEQWPELQRILHWVTLPALEFWIVCHSDTQFNSRIRSLRDFLIRWFEKSAYPQVIL